MTRRTVHVVHALRTPVAPAGGELADRGEQWLAARVFKRIACEMGNRLSGIDEILVGVARQTSTPSNAARAISLLAGYPEEIAAYTVAMQSASGLAALAQGFFSIASGANRLVLAGGTESASLAPLELHDARYDFSGARRVFVDPLKEQMPASQPRALYGELDFAALDANLRRRYSLSARDVEAYAEEDFRKTAEGLGSLLVRRAIVPLDFTRGRKEIAVERDGVAPAPLLVAPYGDGAAACILADGDDAAGGAEGALCELAGVGMAAGDPRVAGAEAPQAVERALGGVPPDRVGFVAASVLTASQGLGLCRELTAAGFDPGAINPFGSPLHRGNPQGASGCVAAVHAARAAETVGCGYALAVACAEGGQTVAALFKEYC